MPQRFESLSERLLRDGIAPRHVRRYVSELDAHLDDLIAAQEERGYDGEDAYLRARALLGPDKELAAAMAANGRFRSLAARAPWLVFGVLPPVAVGFGLFLFGMALVLVGAVFRENPHGSYPAWCGPIAAYYCEMANYGVGPLAAVSAVLVAMRQRVSWRWPGLAVGLAALFSALTTMAIAMPHAGLNGHLSIGMGNDQPALIEFARFTLTAAMAAAMYAVCKRPGRAV